MQRHRRASSARSVSPEVDRWPWVVQEGLGHYSLQFLLKGYFYFLVLIRYLTKKSNVYYSCFTCWLGRYLTISNSFAHNKFTSECTCALKTKFDMNVTLSSSEYLKKKTEMWNEMMEWDVVKWYQKKEKSIQNPYKVGVRWDKRDTIRKIVVTAKTQPRSKLSKIESHHLLGWCQSPE